MRRGLVAYCSTVGFDFAQEMVLKMSYFVVNMSLPMVGMELQQEGVRIVAEYFDIRWQHIVEGH